ncbi:hypothetical protein WJX79_002966 [Trebouxia sp. C0005]
MEALLEFPQALADAMPDLLDVPTQGTRVVAQLLPLFRFLQAAVHHASRPPPPEAPPTPPPSTAQPAIAGAGAQAAPAASELPPATASSDGSGLEDMDEDEDMEEEVEIEDDADEEAAANPRDPQTVLVVPTDNDGVTAVLQMLEQELAAYEEQELAAIGTGRGGRGGRGRGRGRATRSTRLEMDDLVDLAHETALARSAGGRGRRGRGQGRDAGRGRGAAAEGAASNARGAADVMREDGTVQCTFSGNGDDFIDQHWYFCYTCGLVDSKGCCSACAQVCHAGHDLVYSTHSRFFCDCGAGVPRCPACKCLTSVHPPETAPPTPAQASSPAEDFPVLGHPFNGLQEWDPAHETSLELEHLWQIPPADDGEEVFTAGLVTSAAQAVRRLCTDDPHKGRAALEQCALGISSICKALLDQLKADAKTAAKQALRADGPTELTPQVEAMVVDEPQIVVFKGSFKLAAEPRGVARSAALAAAEMVLGRDSVDALEAQVVSRCTAAASPASGLLAVARARQLAFVDLAAAATAALAQSQGSAVDNMAVLARHSARFDVLQIQFDPVTGKHLAVAGLRIVQVWSISPAAKTQDRLPVQLPTPEAIITAASGAGIHQLSAASAAAGGGYMDLVLDIAWLPGSDTCLAVTMPLAVLVFDLAMSARQPSVAIVVPSSDLIASSAVGAHMVAGQGPSPELQTCLVILTREATVCHGLAGLVATVFESAHSDRTGCAIVTQIQEMQSANAPVVGIASLPLPHAQQVAIVALDSQGYLHLYTTPLADSVVVWDPTTEPSTAPQERTGTGSVGSRGVVGEQQQEAAQPAAESGRNWTRFLNLARSGSVSFQEQLEQSGSPMHLNPDALRSRAFERLLAGSSSSLGSSSQPSLAAVGRTISTGAEAPSASTPAADAAAPPAATAGGGGGGGGTAGPFTFDFFEKTRCISGEVKLSGDLSQSGGSERAWRVLVASGTYLEAPSASGMRINVRPDDASLVVVGVRVMVGGSGGRYSPSEVKLGGRAHPLPSPSAKRWHVLRMTPAEALAAAPDTPMQVGPAQNPASLPRLEGLEVYARPKADLVKEAAAAAEAEAAEAPSGNLSSNLSLAAISLPGHLVAQKAAQTCSNFVLSQGLLTLTSLHQLLAGLPDAEEPVPDAMPAGMTATASNAGLELASWTLKVVCLPKQPDAVQHSLQQIDEANLDLALHGLQRCVCQAPPAPALWPDTFLWWYLLIAAKVLTIAMHRPASLTAFFRHQQSKTRLGAHTNNSHFPPSFLRWLVQASIAAVISCAEAVVGTVEDSAGAASPEGMPAVSAMAEDLLLCPMKEVSEAAAAELTQALLTSKKASQEPSGSVQPATAQPSIQLHASPAAAAALATSLAGLVKGHSWPGYQLLGQLAVTDIQDGNERVTGIAQHVMSFTLKALLNATAGDSSAASNPAQTMQLLLLAQICSACEDSGEAPPTTGDSAAPKEEGSRETTGQLAEALPGEAPGCGELLKSKTSAYKISWDAYQKKQGSFLGNVNALAESEACVVTVEACLCLAAAAGPQIAEKTDVAVWKELLSKVQQCEQLSKGRQSMRKLMLQLYGGHSAYHDAKARTRLTHAHKALQAAAASHNADTADHSAAQQLVACLGKAKDAAETRPKVWLSLVESEEGVLQALVAGLLSWQMPSALERTLQMVMLLLPPPEIPKDGLKVEKATRDLDLKWLYVSQSTSTAPQHSPSTLSSQQLTATPYAHLVATLLLAGPSKANGIYQQLQRVVNFEGYYLDGEQASSVPQEAVYQSHKLDSLEAEAKYTDNRTMVRLTGRYQIKSFTLQVHSLRKPRTVRQVHIYHCAHPLAELSELKTRPDLWRKCATLSLKPYQTQAKHSLTVPVAAGCIMMEFAHFWENLSASSAEVLQCPRCSQVVAHPQGYCRYCKENAYQCRHCRNINHEKLDAFMCNECGHSRFGKFELSMSCSPCVSYPPLRTQDDMLRALACLEHNVSTAHARHTSLATSVKTLTAAMSSWGSQVQGIQQQPSSAVAPATTAATAKVEASQAVDGVKSALTAYLRQGRRPQDRMPDLSALGPAELKSPGGSYRCADTFLGQCLPFMSLDVASSMQQELGLLTELVTGASNADAQAWQSQMLLLFQLLLPATGAAGHNPAISEHVIMPCLTMLLHTIGVTPTAAGAVSHSGSASDARTPVEGSRPSQPEANPATAGPSGGAHGEGQKLLEEVGPGVSLGSLAVGRSSFQSYLEKCNTQAGMLAAGTLNSQARRALRCGRLWRHHAHHKAMRRSTGTASATDLPSPAPTTAPLTYPQSASSVSSLPLLESGALISALLLNPTHESVRSLAVSLLKQLCLGTPHMTIRLVSRLAALLPQASAAGPAAAQYFNLLEEQMADTAVTMHMVSHDMLASVMQQIKLHTNVLVRAEYGCSLALLDATNPGSATSALSLRGAKEVTGGYSLTRLTPILAALTASPGAPAKFASDGLLGEALLALAGMSAVEVGRSHLTDDAEGSLLQLLHELWVTGTLAARSEFARAGMSMLTQLWDSQGPSTNMLRLYAHLDATILEEVCTAIKPESNEAVYLLLLDKSPTQEEFIRGQLTNNPYNSAEVGPLMRDVKNFICRELDMEGLVDDDFGMELLVGGAIISLSLPLRLVWECVWRPTLPSAGSETSGEGSTQGLPGRGEVDVMGPPMVVTYRLQGLDGEATERMIEHLAEPASEQQEAEQEYDVARVLADQAASGSLPRLLERLVSAKEQQGEEYRLLLKLLLHASHLKVCKQTMLSVGGLQSLLQHLHQLLLPLINPAMPLPSTSVSGAADSGSSTAPSGGSTDSKGKLAVAAEDLDILMTILEALAASDAAANSQVSAKGLGVDVHGLADGLKALVEAGLTKAAGGLARVLPYLAHGNAAAQAALLDHYAGCLDLTALDAAGPDTPPHQAQQSELQSLLRLTESTEEGQAQALPSTSFRALVLDRAIPQALAGYALALFNIEAQAQADVPIQPQAQLSIDDQSEPQPAAQAGVSVTAPAEHREEDTLDGQAGRGQMAAGELGRQQGDLCKKGSEQWSRAISMAGLPWALQLLAAFSCGQPATCNMLAEKVDLLSLLHQLEAVSSGSTIGPLAESLLEELQEAGASPVGEAIKTLRAATKAAMKQKAMARRKAMLVSLNMPPPATQGSADSGGPSSAADPTSSSQAQHAQQVSSKEEEEERRGLVCMVCKEGYASRPKELLAAYCYCMKLRSGEGFGAVPELWRGSTSTKSDALQAWMSVSHFNLIHSSCHQAAKQADAGLRAPKREWEGATLRNGETLCNNLLPLKTAGVSDTLHAAAVATFTEALGHAPHKDSRGGATTSSSGSRRGHSSSSASGDASTQVGAIAGSMACLLQRLAYGESLCVESRGGGRQSNARLLPYLFQLGLYFAGFCSESDLETQKARLDKLREWPSSSDTASSSTPAKATAYLLCLCQQLKGDSDADWHAHAKTRLEDLPATVEAADRTQSSMADGTLMVVVAGRRGGGSAG